MSFLAIAPLPNLAAESASVGPAPSAITPSLPTLTDARKNEIRAEELFRRQVAKENAAEEDKRGSWWSVLNSAFAVWFLTSVVVSGLTWTFARYQKKHADKKQNSDLQARLATEISYRVSNGLVAMHLDEKRIGAGNVYSQGAIYNEALAYLDNRVYAGTHLLDFSIYQDYKTRRFLSLLYELRGSVDLPQRAPLLDAQARYTAIETLADDAAIQNPAIDKPNSLSAVAASIEHLEKLRENSAWQAIS